VTFRVGDRINLSGHPGVIVEDRGEEFGFRYVVDLDTPGAHNIPVEEEEIEYAN
jgi:hypothetical protein